LLREFAEREGCILVDFEPVIAAEERPAALFWDDHHPNEEGARLLADQLFEALRDRVQAGLKAREERPAR
jgi:lysophospholipase L1-like esterase